MNNVSAAAALTKRLRRTCTIDEDDLAALNALSISWRRAKSNEVIVRTGDRPSHCCVLIDGFIIRAKNTAEGQRQIIAIHQPGDIPDLQSLFLHVLDHDVIAAGDCQIGFIPHDQLRALIKVRPNVGAALWRDTLIDAAIFREWIVNVGRRSGPSRLAHLWLEIFTRLQLIDRTEGNQFRLPLTQVQIGEAIGMSAVHVNRILQAFRRDGVLDFERGTAYILDEHRLRELGGFDPLYLHLSPAL
jgi:CRP-like cAMP-binding protein